jgi:RNA polymerase sigma factor (sigma-70 family)
MVFPVDRTTTTLLERLHDPADEAVWRQFDARFRPILVRFARRWGLGAEDAADAAQETLARFARSYRTGGYRRERGRLSSWVFGIARHCVLEQRRARGGFWLAAGSLGMDDVPERCSGNDNPAAVAHSELQRAIRELRENSRIGARTVHTFELLALNQLAPTEVATRLGITLNDVYLAKHRCVKRLRSLMSTDA